MDISPSAIESIRTLCVGLALSGLLASAFELVSDRRASFSLLQRGGVGAVAALPILAFGAPSSFCVTPSAAAGSSAGPSPSS